MKTLSIVVPCYNEQETINLFVQKTRDITDKLPLNTEFILVNDGSTDDTYTEIKKLVQAYPEDIHFIDFSRNFGKEAALYAGLNQANGDYVTVMDADLQDPPDLLPEMLRLVQEKGYDVVGTRRIDRKGEPPLRTFFAKAFYRIINRLSDTKMESGVRDFRLMTRQVVVGILQLSEYNRFSKGIFSWVGYKTTYLPYENIERVAGTSSWSFWSLLRYSIEGIINFSETPLMFATYTGIISCLGSLIGILFIVIRTTIFGDATPGWPSLVCMILFIGGVQLLCLGIIGKYLSKIFLEVKQRPLFLIREESLPLKKESEHE